MAADQPTCKIDGCERPHKAKGLCGRHYESRRDVLRGSQPCSVKGCQGLRRTREMCAKHYQRWLQTGTTGPAGDLYESNAGRTCEGPECDRTATRKGLCVAHYAMVRAERDLQPIDESFGATRSMTFAERMDYYTSAPDVNGCRLWTGRINNGYGSVWSAGKEHLAHRASLERSGVVVPPQLHVHHKCAVRACVEPSHLQVVQPWENSAEMHERNFYLRRIQQLEEALSALDDCHPLLTKKQ